MKLVKNAGTDRVIDELRRSLVPPSSLDLASSEFSLFAYAELRDLLDKLAACRIVLPNADARELGLTGSDADRAFRNRLQLRWVARECGAWLRRKAELRVAPGRLPQSILIGGVPTSENQRVITGSCAFTTEGLGITPGNQFGLIQCSEKPEESAVLGSWFTSLWGSLPASDQQKTAFLGRLQELADSKAPSLVYYLTLFQVFKDLGNELDEERIVKSATGIRNTTVWKKLYRFQRDGVIGAIDKLERLGGCIIADSVGLGKTFEALAIIKYYELRNDRVLVLVPKQFSPQLLVLQLNASAVAPPLLLPTPGEETHSLDQQFGVRAKLNNGPVRDQAQCFDCCQHWSCLAFQYCLYMLLGSANLPNGQKHPQHENVEKRVTESKHD